MTGLVFTGKTKQKFVGFFSPEKKSAPFFLTHYHHLLDKDRKNLSYIINKNTCIVKLMPLTRRTLNSILHILPVVTFILSVVVF